MNSKTDIVCSPQPGICNIPTDIKSDIDTRQDFMQSSTGIELIYTAEHHDFMLTIILQ